jgi:hypothetical protein
VPHRLANSLQGPIATPSSQKSGCTTLARVRTQGCAKYTKELLNALDNDGTLRGWEENHNLAMAPPPRFKLPDGSTFDLTVYVASRADLTAEFKDLMPDMIAFVADWLRTHGDARSATSERTAKSYFLQEAEGISRRAKMRYAELHSGVRITNLQHDGVMVALAGDVEPSAVCAAMSAACREALGYVQPVEEKPVGEGVDDSEAESSNGEEQQYCG